MNHSTSSPSSSSPDAPSSCGCGPSGCCGGSKGLNRREFLTVAGAGIVATSLARDLPIMAGPFGAADLSHGHLIPADKHLDPQWVAQLFQRGGKEVFSGEALMTIGMPCGGIGSGQLYLCGDGTLGCWQIFNNAASNWVGQTGSTWEHTGIDKPVDQGFAVAYRTADGEGVKRLNSAEFAGITFKGEYPIGTVTYRQDGFPLEVDMEAFSPFIPLNAADSALPATVFHITVRNASQAPLKAAVEGWLQNAVGYAYGEAAPGYRTTRPAKAGDRALFTHSAEDLPTEERQAWDAIQRPPIVFTDFEGDTYGDWTVEGDAFGTGPAKGTLPNQNPVSGYQGERLVNSFAGGDVTTGRLISPQFTIERRYIKFLVGGGAHKDMTCINLVVDGQAVRTATGRNNEALAWASWNVEEWQGKTAHIEIVDQATGPWGHINVDQIEFADAPPRDAPEALLQALDCGTMTLAAQGPEARVYWGSPVEPETVGRIGDGWGIVPEPQRYAIREPFVAHVRTGEAELRPGQSHTFTFVLAWHFPNNPLGGHSYAARFADAEAVANYVLDMHDRLSADTRLWRDTYYDSSLPYWLLDRLHSTASYLATGTCQWWENGRFWAYEGVTCCHGTCTHVWNYAHGHARLFPEMVRTIREMQDFATREEGGGFHPDTGLVGFRSDDNYAADGQCGTILKAYREHLMSADDTFVRRNWPRIRKALEFSISHDQNADGLIEDLQHNTYDINYHGANTFVGSLYLAALRAGEEMARDVGDTAFADQCRAIHEKGRQSTLDRLWNGEYFVQDVDLQAHPQHQYKDGCLSDHLFGQGWAHQVGLGYIYPVENVRSALQAVWKYNWAPDITPYNEEHPPFRWFISPGQAGLLTCTWPRSEYLPEGTMYKDEVWTGIEYQVAGHMVWEGMLTEALAICRAIHDRYHPSMRNPYNEVECGDHYARALASWGVYLALAGFGYHGPKGHLAFAPRITPEDFRAAFTTAQGWGTFQQQRAEGRQTNGIILRWGTLRLNSLALALPDSVSAPTVDMRVGDRPIETGTEARDGMLHINLSHELVLNAGEMLELTIAQEA